ncbi:MAG: hypothetical protein ACYTEQ_11680 [Planctomycetota bacterium]|jgi:hypothetical protein
MSLDVYLTLKAEKSIPSGSGIFVRESGEVKEISRAEWDEKFPGSEPIIVSPHVWDDLGGVYERNITHNLNKMADKAGIYQCLWRPDENGITKALQLIAPLTEGLLLLKSDPARFKKFNPPNGWGTYEGLVDFVEDYLKACEKYPDAEVSVSR